MSGRTIENWGIAPAVAKRDYACWLCGEIPVKRGKYHMTISNFRERHHLCCRCGLVLHRLIAINGGTYDQLLKEGGWAEPRTSAIVRRIFRQLEQEVQAGGTQSEVANGFCQETMEMLDRLPESEKRKNVFTVTVSTDKARRAFIVLPVRLKKYADVRTGDTLRIRAVSKIGGKAVTYVKTVLKTAIISKKSMQNTDYAPERSLWCYVR